jgi:hypothetical protein
VSGTFSRIGQSARGLRVGLRAALGRSDPVLREDSVDGGTWDTYGFEQLAADSIKLRARTVRIHGIAKPAIAEQTRALSGDPAWIYAEISRSGYATATVKVQSTEPTSDASFLRIALYKFALEDGVYVLSDPCRFDIHIDSPSRG